MPSIPRVGDRSFNIWGNLRMPEIPRVRDQSFNIWGDYRAPNIPRYQMGTPYVPRTQVAIVEKGERIIPASQNMVGRMAEGGQGGGNVIVNIPRGAFIVYGDIRTKMDEEELVKRASAEIGQQVGKEILRTVPL